MANSERTQDFEAVKLRLEEIADAVSDESMSLDDALDLYEEAVTIGLQISDLLEDGIVVDESALAGEGAEVTSATEEDDPDTQTNTDSSAG